MLSKEEVMHVAHLARIEITDEEIEKYQKDLLENEEISKQPYLDFRLIVHPTILIVFHQYSLLM